MAPTFYFHECSAKGNALQRNNQGPCTVASLSTKSKAIINQLLSWPLHLTSRASHGWLAHSVPSIVRNPLKSLPVFHFRTVRSHQTGMEKARVQTFPSRSSKGPIDRSKSHSHFSKSHRIRVTMAILWFILQECHLSRLPLSPSSQYKHWIQKYSLSLEICVRAPGTLLWVMIKILL